MTNKPEEGPHVPDTVALLEAQAKRIATLEELRNEYRRAITLLKEDTRARIAELEAANAELYARCQAMFSLLPDEIKIGDIQRAVAALKGEK